MNSGERFGRMAVGLVLTGSAMGAGDRVGPELVLVRDGRPAAAIVLSETPGRAAEFAAVELQAHVKRISGATLPIVAPGTDVSGTRILVGESAATRTLGLPGEPLGPQEYLIRFLPRTLVLLGRDSPAEHASTHAPAPVGGRFGNALAFDGDRTVLTVPDPGFDDSQGTLEAWVWLPAEPPAEKHGTILRLDGADPWTYHIVQRDMGGNCVSYSTYDGKQVHRVYSAPLGEGWHHIAATFSAERGRMELFVDGVSCGASPYARTTCKGALLGIGGVAPVDGTVGNPFAGRIDDVRISTTIRENTGVPSAPAALDAHTGCLFRFDEERGLPRNETGGLSGAPPPELFAENGSLYAVYDFLERFCDVRWYAPGDIGVVCPSAPTLAVGGRDIRRTPAMDHRWITPTPLYLPTPPDRVTAADLHVWKLRMRIGGRPFWICHSFEGYYDRFLADHPDWFAQGYPNKPPQMCYTNPEFIEQVARDARDHFDGEHAKPGAAALGDVFGLVPMDNMSWCKCSRCQAELDASEDRNPQFNNGKASNYVFRFVNRVATEVRKTHPDKWIGALAYSDYAYHPDAIALEPNVVVQLCLHTRNWWCPSMEANDRKVLWDWRREEPSRPIYLWLYYNFPALNATFGDFHYFPGYFAHTVASQMDLYHANGIRGIFMEHSSEFTQSYLMDQIEFYVTLKLADDPTLDGNALIDEFFRRYYGAAAGAMQELYCRIEELFTNPDNYPIEVRRSLSHHHQTATLAWESLGTSDRMRSLAKLMAQAKDAAGSGVERERVALFEQGQWSYLVAGRAKYEATAEQRRRPLPKVTVPGIADAGGAAARVDWEKAAVLADWSSLGGVPTQRRVEGRIVHDGSFLYLQLTEWLDTASLRAGGQVWDGDDFECFIARQRRGAYRQIAVSPDGRHAESARGEAAPDWDSGAVLSSDTTSGEYWTVRLALPLDKLLPGGVTPGATFYANVYRASPGATNLLAWTPTFAAGFHDTTRLGEFMLEPAQP